MQPMSNSTAIFAILNTPAYEVVRDMLRANYLSSARGSLAGYQKRIATWTPPAKPENTEAGSPNYDRRAARNFREMLAAEWPRMGFCSKFVNEVITPAGEYRCVLVGGQKFNLDTDQLAIDKAAAPLYVLDEARVIAAADQDWAETKDFYAARVGEKADLIGGDAKITLDISLSVELVGRCTAVLGDRTLVLATSLKTNYRYGENSANGHLTVYRQVPTLVESAKGFDPFAAESAKFAAADAAKNDRKAKVVELNASIRTLEKQKDAAEQTYRSLKWTSEGWRSFHNEPAPTPEKMAEAAVQAKEAYKAVKAIREQIKAAKLALKTARTTKG
jgi:hypothetical protein